MLNTHEMIIDMLLGPDSPTIKLCYLSFQLVAFLLKTLLEEKTVIVELGESQPWERGRKLCLVPQGNFVQGHNKVNESNI